MMELDQNSKVMGSKAKTMTKNNNNNNNNKNLHRTTVIWKIVW